MGTRILVTFATKYGATAEIAERIGEVLRNRGLETDVRPAHKIDDLSMYNAVVLGSALYIGRWRKEAVRFLKNFEKDLVALPAWIFSSGPTGEGDPVELLQGWRLPGALQPIVDRVQPCDITVFHGSVNPSKLNPLEKWMISKVNSPVGDFRDWDAITAWATTIGETLQSNHTD